MDEARRKGLEVDLRSLSRDLGVPAVGIVARTGEGLHALLATVAGVVPPARSPRTRTAWRARREFQHAVAELVPLIEQAAPGVPNARWMAMRLLDGDHRVQQRADERRAGAIVTTSRRPGERVPPDGSRWRARSDRPSSDEPPGRRR